MSNVVDINKKRTEHKKALYEQYKAQLAVYIFSLDKLRQLKSFPEDQTVDLVIVALEAARDIMLAKTVELKRELYGKDK